MRWERSDERFRVVVFARNDRTTFRVEYGFVGTRLDTTTAPTEEEAVSIAVGYWAEYQRGGVETGPVVPVTLKALVDLVCSGEYTAKTIKGYRAVWRLFAEHLGTRHPDRIYGLDVRNFLHDRNPSTRNTYLRTLRATLRRAVKMKWISSDATAGIPFAKEAPKLQWLPSESWDTFLLYCTDAHRIRAEFVLETGLRAAELAAARWDWVSGDIGLRGIRIAADSRGAGFSPKWGHARGVPLSDRAAELLEEATSMWPGHGQSDFIFSTSGLSSLTNFAAETREALARARKGGNEIRSTDFHGLRRSAGARWLELGASLYEVSQLLGHRDVATTAKWYAGVTERHLAGVIARSNKPRLDSRPPIRRRSQ